jgi:signal transduction histidine kinase
MEASQKSIYNSISQPVIGTNKNGAVTFVNTRAQLMNISETDELPSVLSELLLRYTSGTLMAEAAVTGDNYLVALTADDDGFVFVLSPESDKLDGVYSSIGKIMVEPLSVLNIVSSLVLNSEKSADDSRAQKYGGHLLQSVAQLKRIAGHLQSMSQLSGMESSPTDIVEVCRTAVEITEAIFDGQCKFEFTAAAERCFVFGNREVLDKMLFSMLGNAIKHASDDSRLRLEITDRDDSYYVLLTSTNSEASNAVSLGVWDSFLHPESVEGSSASSGFGMTYIQKAARAQGGAVFVESSAGGTVSVAIKLPKPPADTTNMLRTPPAQDGRSARVGWALVEYSNMLPSKLYEPKFGDI